jgi:Flp pilus assembly protein TadD
MRSADLSRGAVLVLALLALGGCSTLSEGMKAVQDTVVAPVAKAITPATAASAPASAASAAATPPAKVEAPVPPAAQRAFDDALRALRAGRTEDAERGFKALAQSHPDLGGPHANLGLIYRQAGKFEDSVAALERALDLDANYAAAQLNLGILFDLYLRDNARALEAYERYAQLSGGKDATVAKWVTELKNRKPAGSAPAKKEQS